MVGKAGGGVGGGGGGGVGGGSGGGQDAVAKHCAAAGGGGRCTPALHRDASVRERRHSPRDSVFQGVSLGENARFLLGMDGKGVKRKDVKEQRGLLAEHPCRIVVSAVGRLGEQIAVEIESGRHLTHREASRRAAASRRNSFTTAASASGFTPVSGDRKKSDFFSVEGTKKAIGPQSSMRMDNVARSRPVFSRFDISYSTGVKYYSYMNPTIFVSKPQPRRIKQHLPGERCNALNRHIEIDEYSSCLAPSKVSAESFLMGIFAS